MIMCDNPGGAAIALVMQITLIGWPFASNMAIREVREYYELNQPATTRPESEPGSETNSEIESKSE